MSTGGECPRGGGGAPPPLRGGYSPECPPYGEGGEGFLSGGKEQGASPPSLDLETPPNMSGDKRERSRLYIGSVMCSDMVQYE